jgi:hypothetical protein
MIMTSKRSKQITIRFSMEEWEKIVVASEKYGVKPVQFVRSCVLQRLNGTLVDSGTIDEILLQGRTEHLRGRY